MKFKEGDRVHVLRYDGEDVDFYGRINHISPHFYFIDSCTEDIAESTNTLLNLIKPNNLFFGSYGRDYYVLAEDEEDTEAPVVQRVADIKRYISDAEEYIESAFKAAEKSKYDFNQSKVNNQKVELKKQYIIEVKKGLYVNYVDSKEAFYFTKNITEACVFKNREYPTKFAEIIDAKILEIKRYVEV